MCVRSVSHCTKVQILTLSTHICVCVCAVFERLIIVVLAQFTCFISTKVQILTPEGLQWFERLIIVGIVYSSLSLAIDAPLLPEESELKKWLVVSNYTLRCQYLYFCASTLVLVLLY